MEMTFDEWQDLKYNDIWGWTEDTQFFLYQFWAVGGSIYWAMDRLQDNDYLSVYKTYLRCVKCDGEDKHPDWTKEIKKKFFKLCMNLINEYCLD